MHFNFGLHIYIIIIVLVKNWLIIKSVSVST